MGRRYQQPLKTTPTNKSAFRESERKYKKRDGPVDYSDLISVNNCPCDKIKLIKTVPAHPGFSFLTRNDQVEIFSLVHIPGALLIRNPFPPEIHLHFVRRALEDYSNGYSNLELHWNLPNEGLLGAFRKNPDMPVSLKTDPAKTASIAQLLKKMRWIELGKKYDWNTKKYENVPLDFPDDLGAAALEVFECVSDLVGQSHYKPEAGIVNYYQIRDTLTAHVDDAEENMDAPLISFSFGHSCVFLIGSDSMEVEPEALRLDSGDILIMSGSSRYSYHGVPRIIENSLPEFFSSCPKDGFIRDFMSQARININVRQII